MPGTGEWVMLAYKLPREPSSCRVTVWRKLRRLGAVQVSDGLVTLPGGTPAQEQFERLADEIVEGGGTASLWFARPATFGEGRTLQARMSAATAADYRALIVDANEVLAAGPPIDRRTVARLARELDRIRRRDHFPPAERDRAVRAVERLRAATD